MDDFDRIEADRERNEGLVYEEWWDRAVDRASEDADLEEDEGDEDDFFEEGR